MTPPKTGRKSPPTTKWVAPKTGAGVTGAGGGALLLSLLQGHQEMWAKILMYLAPSLSLVISAGIVWSLRQIDDYARDKRQHRKYLFAIKIAKEVLDDDTTSAAKKEDARRLLDEAKTYRLDQARTRLGIAD